MNSETPSSPASALVARNDVRHLDEHGIWVPAGGENAAFGYSDGESAERRLHDVLSKAQDRSSASAELEQGIGDWATEYHLSYRRANLLRLLAFDRPGLKVLEPGCGCGAMTRYLAEQGCQVDAVEGAPVRARLAAMRTAGMGNVSIVCANYNEIELPEKHYDVVLFTGVLEYAGRFLESARSHQDAVRQMLKRARRALAPNGVIVVAIENRVGLKYLLGANEDHYAKPMVGVHNYPDDAGIRTYSQSEWRQLVSESGIEHVEFCYPFSDYKVPSAAVAGRWLENCPERAAVVADIASRDHVAPWSPGVDEGTLWRGLAEAGQLGTVANSFLLVLGAREAASNFVANDFVHVSGTGRAMPYRTMTLKKRGSDRVEKHWLTDPTTPRDAVDGVIHKPSATAWVDGVSLAERWRRGAQECREREWFENEVRDYATFVHERSASDAGAGKHFDLIPANIVIDADASWQVIDDEWQSKNTVDADFVVFRGLVYTLVAAPEICKALGSGHTLGALIADLMRAADIDIAQRQKAWIARENRFQDHVSGGARGLALDDSLARVPGCDTFECRLHWSVGGEDTTDHAMRRYQGVVGASRQRIVFRLPTDLTSVARLRLDPAEQGGIFHLYSFRVSARDDSGTQRTLMDLRSGAEIAVRAQMSNVTRGANNEHDVFAATSADPIFDFDTTDLFADAGAGEITVEFEMDWPRDAQFHQVQSGLLGRIDSLETELGAAQSENGRLKRVEQELNLLKGSRVWRTAERGRDLLYRRTLSRVPGAQRAMLAVSRGGLRKTASLLARGRLREALAPGSAHISPGGVAVADGPDRDYKRLRAGFAQEALSAGAIRAEIAGFERRPLISVVMPVYNVEPVWLEKAVASVLAQSYENFELIVVDDCSPSAPTRHAIERLNHPRVKTRRLDSNRNISGATNEAIELASGEYIAFVDHDDELDPDALFEVVRVVNSVDPDAIYTDEDFISPEGEYTNPHFKPDYSPDLLLSHNYITHFSVVRRSLVDRVGCLRSQFDGAQDYDFWLRVSENTDRIHHISKVLYHWRMIEASTSMNVEAKPEALEASRRALESALERRRISADVLHANSPYFFRVRRHTNDRSDNLVSIVVPFKDKPDFLDSCIGTILETSSWENFEIVGVSNNSEQGETFERMRHYEALDSRVRFIEHNVPFNFSVLVNEGVRQARGRHVVLLNNDVEIINWDWIEALAEHLQRPEVGVVGGKLFYDNNTIQHAGIIVGIGGYAGHAHKHFAARRAGYFNRANIIQNMSALTGAFLAVRRDVYEKVGGFNEDDFKVACNDVDFCLRVAETGLLNVFTPYAMGYHYESSTRGYEDTPDKKARFEMEKAKFSARHSAILESGDPFYNSNLSLDNEQFGLRMPT